MFGKPKLAPALFCILTFCVVSVVIVDAAPVPFLFLVVSEQVSRWSIQCGMSLLEIRIAIDNLDEGDPERVFFKEVRE